MSARTMRAWAGRALERGTPWLSPLGGLVSRLARAERTLRAPPGAQVICVGGATLGGSGRTALVLSCAEYIHSRGARVAIVGHAYGARPARAARVVGLADALAEVGDEARMLARALGDRAVVVLARDRQTALLRACELAPFVLLDGVLQTAPGRAALSLLAVRADAPWGSARVVPAGDLRASRATLLAACDEVVSVRVPLRVAAPGGVALAGARVGLVTALARPSRLVHALTSAGAEVTAHLDFGDHGPVDLAELRREVLRCEPRPAAWVASAKCWEHVAPLEPFFRERGTPLLRLEGRAELPVRVAAALDRVISRSTLAEKTPADRAPTYVDAHRLP